MLGLVELVYICFLLQNLELRSARLAIHVRLQGCVRAVWQTQQGHSDDGCILYLFTVSRVHHHLHLPLLLPHFVAYVWRIWL
jgi:hypothetical protein